MTAKTNKKHSSRLRALRLVNADTIGVCEIVLRFFANLNFYGLSFRSFSIKFNKPFSVNIDCANGSNVPVPAVKLGVVLVAKHPANELLVAVVSENGFAKAASGAFISLLLQKKALVPLVPKLPINGEIPDEHEKVLTLRLWQSSPAREQFL